MEFPFVKTTNYYGNALNTLIDPTAPAPSSLTTAKLALGTSLVTLGINTAFADITEATFAGYAESATVVWGLSIRESDGSASSLSPMVMFRCNDDGSTPSVTIVCVTDGAASPDQLNLAAARVTPAIPMILDGDGFGVVAIWNDGPNSGNCVVNILM